MTIRPSTRRLRFAAALFATALALGACKVRLIDSYNRESEEGLLRTYGKIESLFDAMTDATEPGARVYSRFADRYAEIHELIRVQVLREDMRPLNAESRGIVAQIDTVFTRYRADHRKDNGFNPALTDRHRDVMRRLFTAAVKAERAKADSDDRY
ncbi:MAG: hypothetical protein WD825_11575 [Gemmatimonadaceae bacterium]